MNKFHLQNAVEVPRMQLKASLFKHVASNHTHLHVQKRGDVNNVFSLAFKTNAPDKTGVPHILEHTTLCGSQKFPVRDPFFKMLNRSLANFMNAMTGFDYTYYPFATTNKTDYFNLQKVYMDSVFQPLLKKEDFKQEGWRLEPADKSDPKSPLIFKGVVYNEMKGQLSMPSYLHYISWFEQVYPSMQCSGGDPLYIPDLQYKELLNFHKKNYSPTNCFTYSYGDFEPAEAMLPLLEYLEENTTEAIQPSTANLEPISLTEPVKKIGYGPVDPVFDETKQFKSSLTWYIKNPSIKHYLIWQVLNMLLCDGHGSPMHKALIDSNIGSEFSVNSGVEEFKNTVMFTIGLQGIEAQNLDLFKQTVFKVIESCIETGFPQQRIEALLHQFELSNLEVDANYGLNLLNSVVNKAVFNGEFLPLLDNEKLLVDLKLMLQSNKSLFQDEMAEYLGPTKPYFEYEMHPKASFEDDLKALEAKKLDNAVSKLTDQQKDDIYASSAADSAAAAAAAGAPEAENVDVLPTLTTDDIRKNIIVYPVTTTSLNADIDLVQRNTSTQGLSYLKLFRDMNSLDHSLYPYLPIYTSALTNVGTKSHNISELEELIKLNTGGIGASCSVRSWNKLEMLYSSSCLSSKTTNMYDLLEEVISQPSLDNIPKLQNIIDVSAANITNALSQSGHKYAISHAASKLNKRALKQEQVSGIPFVKLMQRLASLNTTELETELVDKLEQIHSMPIKFRLAGLTTTASAEESTSSHHLDQLNRLIANLNATSAVPAPNLQGIVGNSISSSSSSMNTFLEAPFQVSHVGYAVKGTDDGCGYLSKENAAFEVLAQLLTHRYLHPEIREKGGAYGGGASYNPLDNLFQMFSYRDPNPLNTLEVISRAGEFASKYHFTDRDLNEGKIGIFQSLDAPISPRSEINQHLYLHLTNEERQIYRQNLIDVNIHDLTEIAVKYLLPNLAKTGTTNASCIVGPKTEETNSLTKFTTMKL